MTHKECARCGEIKDVPEGYDVCTDCSAVIGSADQYAEMFAPQAYADAEEQVPQHIREKRARREHENRKRVERWNDPAREVDENEW